MRQLPEILAPCGTLSCLKAAVCAGADAVYFGGQAFNARRSAGNFQTEEIKEAIRLCKRFGVKTNFTLNTLVKESEWPELAAYLDEVLPLGIDAVIVQDLGVAQRIAARYPKVALHASTQMAVQDLDGVRWLQSLGFSRVVLAREVSIEEIKQIHNQSDVELEVFVHGALCYSYSGRCLLSSFHGGRSGNRGACAQPCRLRYEAKVQEEDGRIGKSAQGAFMNLKDRCFDSVIDELLEAGVASLKIEGRMKNEAYVAGTCRYYRRLVDALSAGATKKTAIDENGKEELLQLFNRGGFSSGYAHQKTDMIEPGSVKNQGLQIGKVVFSENGRIRIQTQKTLHSGDELEIRADKHRLIPIRLSEAMIDPKTKKAATFLLRVDIKPFDEVYRVVDPVLNRELTQQYSTLPSVPIDAVFTAKIGKEAVLSACFSPSRDPEKIYTASVIGEVVEKASKQPLTEEMVQKQLSRLGGTVYGIGSLTVETDPEAFIPVSKLNEMRRSLIEQLDAAVLSQKPSDTDRTTDRNIDLDSPLAVSKEPLALPEERSSICHQLAFENKSQLDELTKAQLETIDVFLPSLFAVDKDAISDFVTHAGKKIIVRLPKVGREAVKTACLPWMKAWIDAGVTTFEASLMGQTEWIRRMGLDVCAGPMMGVMNRSAAAFWQQHSKGFFASIELTGKEWQQMGSLKGQTLWVYGRVPYMISEQCVYKEIKGCQKNPQGHTVLLTDRNQETMTVLSHCDLCYSEILSEKPIGLRESMLRDQPAKNRRITLTTESPKEAQTVVGEIFGTEKESKEKRAVSKTKSSDRYDLGHFYKGVL